MFFWNSLPFSMIQRMLAIWSLGSFAFCKSSLNTWEFLAHVLLKPSLEDFEHYFASIWNEPDCAVLNILWHYLSLGLKKKTVLFQSCGHCWVFQICWHIECSTFTASSFRFWNSSAGSPSLPPTLFIVMLPEAQLTWQWLHRMSGSRWVITSLWLSVSFTSFLYSSVYSWQILISSDSFRSIPLLHFIVPIFAWNVPLVSLIFLKKSLVFPILLFLGKQ